MKLVYHLEFVFYTTMVEQRVLIAVEEDWNFANLLLMVVVKDAVEASVVFVLKEMVPIVEEHDAEVGGVQKQAAVVALLEEEAKEQYCSLIEP